MFLVKNNFGLKKKNLFRKEIFLEKFRKKSFGAKKVFSDFHFWLNLYFENVKLLFGIVLYL